MVRMRYAHLERRADGRTGANLYAAGPNVIAGPGLQISGGSAQLTPEVAGECLRVCFAIDHEPHVRNLVTGPGKPNRREWIEQPDDPGASGANVLSFETIIAIGVSGKRPGAAMRPAFAWRSAAFMPLHRSREKTPPKYPELFLINHREAH